MYRVLLQIAVRDDVEALAALPNVENDPCFEDAVLDLFVRSDALCCLEYAIITWPRVVYMINPRGQSLLALLCQQAILEWEINGTRWSTKRIIKICDLIAERRTLPVLRAVRLRLLAILCRRTTMLKDVARLVVKNAALWQRDTWRRWCFIISDQDSISLDRK
jgi:hypothetical protein